MLPTLLLGLALISADDTAIRTELAKLQGTWRQQILISNGKESNIKDSGIVKTVVNKMNWESHWKDGDVQKLEIKLYLDQSPKGIDLSKGDDVVLRAIYFVDGDHIVFRVGDPGKERPKDFGSTEGGETGGITIYRRIKENEK